MPEINDLRLNFNPTSLQALNIILGFIMFGVALEMKTADFTNLIRFPKAAAIGLFNQYLLFPALTFGLVYLLEPPPSMALGMFLVAACPGGNISNFLTHFAKGNTALSVSITALSTVFSVLMTPLLFAFWSSQYPPAVVLLKEIAIHPLEMFGSIVLLLGIPLTLGMLLAHRFPQQTEKWQKLFRRASLVFFLIFIISAFIANWDNFLRYIPMVFGIIFLHNGLALGIGYLSARLGRLSELDSRAVAIEIAIHNTGLGLILVFSFFGGMGGMALVAAWWGIWDLITGLAIATFWRNH